MHMRERVSNWLANSSPWVLMLFAMVCSFSTYFCMYAFRKPFGAATYSGLTFFANGWELKAVFVMSQLLGYTVSKFIGIKVCSEADSKHRFRALLIVILTAELALLLFAVLPVQWKFVALFLNGVPLGMTWGLVVAYLEGRRASDSMMAALSCSFIVSSGAVKDVGLILMDRYHVDQFWMPFMTGLLFFPPFILFAWLLSCMPPPAPEDEAERSHRATMDSRSRWDFTLKYLPGMVLMVVLYFFLTAFRDYRDNFGKDLMDSLKIDTKALGFVFTRMELIVGVPVMLVMAVLNAVHAPKSGLISMFAAMGAGFALMGLATMLLDAQVINGFWWLTLAGMGAYMAYVPHNSILFERILAWTRYPGTVVFAIYLSDAFGYVGAVGILCYKNLAGKIDHLAFFKSFTYGLSVLGVLLVLFSCLYFLKNGSAKKASLSEPIVPNSLESQPS